MKRLGLFLLLLFIVKIAIAQTDTGSVLDDNQHCNPFKFSVMIDGKLPEETETVVHFDVNICTDTLIYCKRRDYPYPFGSFPEYKVARLCEIIPDTASVYIEYNYREPIGYGEWFIHCYKDTLTWRIFKGTGLVIICNFKKERYYIHYELTPPWALFVNYNKKYGSPRCFYKKLFRGLYPRSYTIPDCKTVGERIVPKKHGRGKSRSCY